MTYQLSDSGPPQISRGRLAVVLMLIAEVMVFVGLLGAYVVARHGAPMWPDVYTGPDGKPNVAPQISLLLPLVNAGVLVAALIGAMAAARAAQRGDLKRTRALMLLVTALGVGFLAIMVTEFMNESALGVTLRAGQYGGMTLLITGAHGVHVLATVIWQAILLGRGLVIPFGGLHRERVTFVAMQWAFVTIMWLVLIVLLYDPIRS